MIVVVMMMMMMMLLLLLSVSSFILGSYDKDDGPQLYMVDPSGISYVSHSGGGL